VGGQGGWRRLEAVQGLAAAAAARHLLEVDGAVAVLVPVAEEVDDAHGVGLERVAQLVRHRHARVVVELDARAERGALAAARLAAAQLVLALGRQPGKLADLLVHLPVVDLAVAAVVHLVEDRVDLLVAHALEAKRLDRLAELALADVARAVGVPRNEQVEHARHRAAQRVAQREHQVLVHLDPAVVVDVELVEARHQLGGPMLALLALADERAELVEVERLAVVDVVRPELHRVLPHPDLEALLLLRVRRVARKVLWSAPGLGGRRGRRRGRAGFLVVWRRRVAPESREVGVGHGRAGEVSLGGAELRAQRARRP